MARIKGNRLPVLNFTVGVATPVNLGAYVVNYEFTDGEGEALTQGDYAAGIAPKALELELALDFAADSAFDFFDDNAGAADVDWELKPSNSTTSQTNPEFSGTCTLPPRPNWGVEAGNEDQTFSVTIQLDSYNKAIS